MSKRMLKYAKYPYRVTRSTFILRREILSLGLSTCVSLVLSVRVVPDSLSRHWF